ncbi:MAG: hypothetical protein KDH09_09170 [Chrysiogenetes bacterium]|nr:hypothetical protein [Chrysiogenetes bacterium]
MNEPPSIIARRKRRQDAWFLALLIGLYPAAAHAYIDPGSGALVLQALIAGAVGGVFYFRDKILLVLGKLGLYKPREIEQPEDEASDPDKPAE